MCACLHVCLQSMAALHSLPTMVRSFSHRPPQRSQSGSLLVEGSHLSDGQLAPAGTRASLTPEKSNQSAGAMLTCISVVARAGVQPSSSSMPNLQRPSTGSRAVSFSQQQQGQQQRHSKAGAKSMPAPAEQAPRASQLSLQASPTAASSATLGFSDAPHPAAAGKQLSRQLSPTAAAIAVATAAAARPSLQPSLASPQLSLASSLPTARRSFAFRVGGWFCQPSLQCAMQRRLPQTTIFPTAKPPLAAPPHPGLPPCCRCPPSRVPWRRSAPRA